MYLGMDSLLILMAVISIFVNLYAGSAKEATFLLM